MIGLMKISLLYSTKLLLLIQFFIYETILSQEINSLTTRQSNPNLWPNKQLNVLIDIRSLNDTEQQILAVVFDQIEHKTCIRVNRLPAEKINPFDASQLSDLERNFIYIFKSHDGFYNRAPPIGLSTLGCTKKGRQSIVLTELAFKWPEIILRYHILRSLAVPNLIRPTEQVNELEKTFPLSQKISANVDSSETIHSTNESPRVDRNNNPDTSPLYFVYSTLNRGSSLGNNLNNTAKVQMKLVQYLNDEDLNNLKQLYDCSDYQNRLSVKPLANLTAITSATISVPTSSEQSNAIDETTSPTTESPLIAKKLRNAEKSLKHIINSVAEQNNATIEDGLVADAARSIINYLVTEIGLEIVQNKTSSSDKEQLEDRIDSLFQSFDEATNNQQPNKGCQPLESCQIQDFQERSTTGNEKFNEEKERPILLKMDQFHSNDPQLNQANQMKLTQLNDSMTNGQLLNTADFNQALNLNDPKKLKSEMLISFEQVNQADNKNPIAALASSQVLKLCSCSCQTMTPSSPSSLPPPSKPSTDYELPGTRPTTPIDDQTFPTYPFTYEPSNLTFPPPSTSKPSPATVTDYPLPPQSSANPLTTPPPSTLTIEPYDPWMPPMTLTPTNGGGGLVTDQPPYFTYAPFPTTKAPLITTTTTATTIKTTTSPKTTTTTMGAPLTNTNDSISTLPDKWSLADNACDQIEWVKPNKTVYSSAKIVWDVDRANQNYFLCNSMVKGELVPGKTHGLSCKISNEGKAFELHNFNVLIKPEKVNLAWIQKDSQSFGSKNLPVIGGYSKGQDPYIVSRCLIRDENNDVITLIGYINSQNIGWFPFDDIQIECSQYDVLACVN